MVRPLLTALLGVALCLAGGTFDMASLYLPGVALVVLSVGAIVWVRLAARGATVGRMPGPATVVEDEPYPLRVEVRSGVLRRPAASCSSRCSAGRCRSRDAGRGASDQRALLAAGPASSSRAARDPRPAACTRRSCTATAATRSSCSRVEPVTAPGSGGSGAGADAGLGAAPSLSGRRLDASAAELEIDGLRQYARAPGLAHPLAVRGSSRRDAGAAARRGARLRPLVVLDPSNPAEEEALDKAVRAAASLCVWLARDGCAILLPGDRRPIDIGHDLGAWPASTPVALVEEGPAPAGGVGPRGGAVIWVTGAISARRREALERLPAGSRYVVAPGALPGIRPAFEVAGCTGCLVERVRRGVAA